MPTYICKFPCDGQEYYMEWSSVVDAPVSEPMTREEYEEHYRFLYGEEGMRKLPERLERVEGSGTSDAVDRSPLQEWVKFNRAGPKESRLTFDEIVDIYVRKPLKEKQRE